MVSSFEQVFPLNKGITNCAFEILNIKSDITLSLFKKFQPIYAPWIKRLIKKARN